MQNSDRETRRREFEEIALPLEASLSRMALAMTRNPVEAADLVQETFYKAWRFFPAFRQGSDCKAWLTAILRNAYINRYRRIQRRPPQVEFDEWQEMDPSFRDDISSFPAPDDDVALGDALSDEVLDALDQLPRHFRDVVVLSDVEGLSYQEVADFVGCPIGTVRSRLFRARAMLRGLLGDYAAQNGVGRSSDTVEDLIAELDEASAVEATLAE
ncbi:MAG: ECF RNA polymerase sigma factor SigH [Candidatus Latescibacteria bacterium ADurb.Bin168]|nr:MAG: ECF RNA polymerase sigma factor SigH [Candidatus Latescibacteria bacterium ADurb.Bin168]